AFLHVLSRFSSRTFPLRTQSQCRMTRLHLRLRLTARIRKISLLHLHLTGSDQKLLPGAFHTWAREWEQDHRSVRRRHHLPPMSTSSLSRNMVDSSTCRQSTSTSTPSVTVFWPESRQQ